MSLEESPDQEPEIKPRATDLPVLKGRQSLSRVRRELSEETTNIGDYALFRTSYLENAVTNAVTNVFWFPDKEVGIGELVVVYSKAGKESEKTLSSGAKTHFFYWGSSNALWNTTNFAAVVLLIDQWKSFVPSER